jgi:hypothetical protein
MKMPWQRIHAGFEGDGCGEVGVEWLIGDWDFMKERNIALRTQESGAR